MTTALFMITVISAYKIRFSRMRLYFLTFLVWSVYLVLMAQDTTYQQLHEIEYAQRIALEKINGRYIPKDVDDAIKELDKLVDMVGKAKFKAQPEEMAVRKVHFSFGRWMILNWGFYEGSRLSHYLRGLGITYPDDMATALMTWYHRHLLARPLDIEDLAKLFSERRKKEISERLKKGQVIESKSVPKN